MPLRCFVLRVLLLAGCVAPCVLAQPTPPNPNTPQPYFYPAPPPGFDPVVATDANLAAYGFPKRPSASDPYYPTWAKMVSNAKIRIANPIATTTELIHGSKHGSVSNTSAAVGGVANGNDYTWNWSGAEVYYPNTPGYFAQNGSTTYIAFQQPVLGTENCIYAPYHASVWTGFDGSLSTDLLQAGTDVVYNSNCSTSYVAWYEWYVPNCTVNSPSYPCYETTVNLSVNPGDAMYIAVTYNTSSPNGTAWISDQTTGDYVSVGFNEPPPGAFPGNTADWIVERACANDQCSVFTDLADYSNPDGPYGYLWIYPDYYTPSLGDVIAAGSDPASTSTFDYMLCDTSYWNPSSACPLVNGNYQYISVLYYQQNQGQGGACLWPGTLCFFPYGPAASQ